LSELCIFRHFDEISDYFVRSEKLNDYAVDEFLWATRHWSRLSEEGRLEELDEYHLVETTDAGYRSRAAKLRAYMDEFKRKRKIKTWSLYEMRLLNAYFYRIVQQGRGNQTALLHWVIAAPRVIIYLLTAIQALTVQRSWR
jgi:hypothetical protein